MAGFTIKRNDRRPRWRVQLTVNAVPLDATLATNVRFIMKQGATVKVNKQPMSVVDAATGVYEYIWGPTDTDTSGSYTAEVEVDWGGSPAVLQTFPNTGYYAITIEDDLA